MNECFWLTLQKLDVIKAEATELLQGHLLDKGERGFAYGYDSDHQMILTRRDVERILNNPEDEESTFEQECNYRESFALFIHLDDLSDLPGQLIYDFRHNQDQVIGIGQPREWEDFKHCFRVKQAAQDQVIGIGQPREWEDSPLESINKPPNNLGGLF